MEETVRNYWDTLPSTVKEHLGKNTLLFEELTQGSDRAVAILGGAYVDEALVEAIRLRMKKCEETDWLVGMNGPLGTFKSRICLSYSLGIIGENTFKDMEIIRDIRNDFAHKTIIENSKHLHDNLTFSSQRISSLCFNLSSPQSVLRHKPREEPKLRYVLTVMHLSFLLWNEGDEHKKFFGNHCGLLE
jgi:mannitol operon repressor